MEIDNKFAIIIDWYDLYIKAKVSEIQNSEFRNETTKSKLKYTYGAIDVARILVLQL